MKAIQARTTPNPVALSGLYSTGFTADLTLSSTYSTESKKCSISYLVMDGPIPVTTPDMKFTRSLPFLQDTRTLQTGDLNIPWTSFLEYMPSELAIPQSSVSAPIAASKPASAESFGERMNLQTSLLRCSRSYRLRIKQTRCCVVSSNGKICPLLLRLSLLTNFEVLTTLTVLCNRFQMVATPSVCLGSNLLPS